MAKGVRSEAGSHTCKKWLCMLYVSDELCMVLKYRALLLS